jgi:hypothetical protein
MRHKVVNLLIIILLTGCSKNIHLDPIQSTGTQIVKTLIKKNK